MSDDQKSFFSELSKSLADALTPPNGDDGDADGDADTDSGDGDAVTLEALEEVTKQLASLTKGVAAIAAVLDPGEQKETEGDNVEWEREPGSLMKVIGDIHARVETHHEVIGKVADWAGNVDKTFAKSQQPEGDDGDDGDSDGDDGDGGEKSMQKARRSLDRAIGAAARNGSAVTLV